jgi:hypothetical protein
MSEDKVARALLQYKQALLVVLGIVFALWVIALTGDTVFHLYEVSAGWFGLWLATTIGSIPLGIAMLISNWWRILPLTDRRTTAMGYLLVGFINFFSLALHLRFLGGATGLLCISGIPVVYGLILVPVYVRVYVAEDKDREELFP